MTGAHFVPHPSDGPVLAADIDPFVAEELLPLGTGVQKQVIRFKAALISSRHRRPQTVQVTVGLGGGGWAPLLYPGAAGSVRVYGS